MLLRLYYCHVMGPFSEVPPPLHGKLGAYYRPAHEVDNVKRVTRREREGTLVSKGYDLCI